MPETVEATEEVEQPENQKAPSASEMNEEAKIFFQELDRDCQTKMASV